MKLRFRNKWCYNVTGSTIRNGLVPMIWDTGTLFDRTTRTPKFPGFVRIIVGAAK